MLDDGPLVSVYIPTFNRLDLLRRAVNSVLEQSYPSLEVIVVDDSSTDGTREYLEELASSDKRVVALFNDSNKGACHSRNRAIHITKGKFVTGLDDDDYFLPGRISTFVQHWPQRNKHIVALTSCYCYALPDGVMTQSTGQQTITRENLYLRNLVGSQVFTLRETLVAIGDFDTSLPAWQDYDMWLRLMATGDIENVMQHNYVVDRSHDHERISNTNYEKILGACNTVLGKLEVSSRDSLRVKSQLLIYRWTATDALKYLLLFSMSGDIQGMKAVFMRTLRFIRKTPH